ncbi:MAG: hypothetical protein K9J12_15375 [Melioribacteraceae bacterium]|nr:hypothetical protein [Melioribacteraceae bacterium]MCF8263083.1 hypothetical protein [Melioribacteraceae bacterium]MCF8431357.1 hypothetical protein [Melioribacteraceae bacterium]
MIELTSIYIAGVTTILVGVLHTQFYKLFRWGRDFKRISLINNKIIYTIHIALLLFCFLTGSLTIFYAEELAKGRGLSFGFVLSLSLFWIWRLIWQFYYFRFERKEKTIGYEFVFILLFFILALSYTLPLVSFLK